MHSVCQERKQSYKRLEEQLLINLRQAESIPATFRRWETTVPVSGQQSRVTIRANYDAADSAFFDFRFCFVWPVAAAFFVFALPFSSASADSMATSASTHSMNAMDAASLLR